MAARLLGLRDVPDDELVGIESALSVAGIEHYQTPPGLFGLSPAALWVTHASDLACARQVLESFQAARAWRLAKPGRRRAKQDRCPRSGRRCVSARGMPSAC